MKQHYQWLWLFVVGILLAGTAEAQVSGTVYNDYNNNGQQGAADNGVSNISVIASYEDGTTTVVTTDANGNY